ncbi:MAG: glycosyltransferase family 4 protein, partial [Gammaproteobacteria bacterium]
MRFTPRLANRASRGLRVVIVIENMSFTYDTRVKNIVRTLARAGCRVWVISPRYRGDPLRRVDGQVTSLHFPMPPLPDGFLGHVLEYLLSFVSITFATLAAFVVLRFDVIHICNPPDIYFPLGRLYRLLGKKFIFDLHDLCPELWDARFSSSRVVHKMLLRLERSTLTAANHVLATSETSRQRVCSRTGLGADRISLVRNGPDLMNFPAPAQAAAVPGDPVEVGYIGDMNRQDGIDSLLAAAHHIRYVLGRTDLRYVLIGDGGEFASLREQATSLKLNDVVQFTGRMPPREAMARLANSTLCVQPDLKNSFNDSCVMVKSLEYMALGKPLVAFDLTETQNVCGEAALYATQNSPQNFATQIVKLADDAGLRQRLGELGRRRIEEGLAWSFSEVRLLEAYQGLHPGGRSPSAHSRSPAH